MGRPFKASRFPLVGALTGVFVLGSLIGGGTGSLAQDTPTTIPVTAPDGTVAAPTQPGATAPQPVPGASAGVPNQDGTDIAQFTAGILASMNGGPRIWQSPDAVIPDFNAVNDAIAKASDLDMRVAIWGQADANVNAEDVAASLGQNLGGTIIAISPSSVGVYSASLSDEQIDGAMAGIAGQLAGEQDPAAIINQVTTALSGGSATAGSAGLILPALVGLAILIVGGGIWLLQGRTRAVTRRDADAPASADARESWGVRLNRLLAGRTAAPDTAETDHAEAADPLDDDHEVDQPVRRIAAEVIDIESDMPRPEEVRRSAVGAQTTASSYGKVAARTQLDQIAQRIVALSNQVVHTQDMALMSAFEQVAEAYTEAKTDLQHADRPVDVINVNDRLRTISDQLALLERRIEP